MMESAYVLVDYNRSGDPLVETVTEPDLTSPEEARDFMKQLISILNYLGIFDVNRCIIKADANISIRESNYTRVEIKNITGFKEIERALKYEVTRQKSVIKDNKKIIQETRAWDSNKGITFALRKKEAEEEYGYIIDPDLTITEITDDWLKEIEEQMPELAKEKIKRFIEKYKIDKIDAQVLASDKLLAELFEKVIEKVNPLLAARWLRRELMRVLNYNKKELKDIEINEDYLIELLQMVEKKEITERVGQKIIEKFVEKPFSPKEYIKKQDIKVIGGESEIEKICKEVIKENSKAVDDYKAGEAKAIQFLIGQVMRKTKGQAAPDVVNKIMKKLIK